MYVDTLPWHKQYVNRKSGNGSVTPDSKGVKDLGQKNLQSSILVQEARAVYMWEEYPPRLNHGTLRHQEAEEVKLQGDQGSRIWLEPKGMAVELISDCAKSFSISALSLLCISKSELSDTFMSPAGNVCIIIILIHNASKISGAHTGNLILSTG